MSQHNRISNWWSVVRRRSESGRVLVNLLLGAFGVAALGVWLAQGVYRIAPGENAAILRIGVYHRAETAAGWHWHWPAPLEAHRIANLQQVHREVFGPQEPAPSLRTIEPKATVEPSASAASTESGVGSTAAALDAPSPAAEQDVAIDAEQSDVRAKDRQAAYSADERHWREVAMQTNDHNIVYVPFVMQYRIRDLAVFVQRLHWTSDFVRDVAQAALREEISRLTLEQLFEDRIRAQDAAQRALQTALDRYAGKASALEVQSLQIHDLVLPEAAREAGEGVRAARQWKEQQLAEAKQYETEQRYRAKQYATQLAESTTAYAVERVAQAEASRTEFLQLLPVYRAAPEVTRRRLYLEMMEEVLAKAHTVVIEKGLPSVPSLSPRIEMPSAVKPEAK